MPKAGESDFRDGTVSDPEGKRPAKPKRADASQVETHRWWDKKAKDCAAAIAARVQHLTQYQQPRLLNMVKNGRLYGNLGMYGTGSSLLRQLGPTAAQGKEGARFNACQSGIDTMVSHIGETKPRPYYLTSGGNYKQQRQAKKLTMWNDGVFYETQAYRKGPQAFRDAAVWGDGFVYVFVRGGKICLERVIGAELWLDEMEGQYGAPRCLDRVKVVDRDELAAVWPEKADDIAKAPRSKETMGGVGNNISDMVTVAESWRLPSYGPDGKLAGGKWATCLVGAEVMLEEPTEWAHDFFPFAHMRWCPPLVGFWSQGGAEQVRGKQLWLNELYWMAQKATRLAGTIKYAVEYGAKIVDEHINNEIGAGIRHAPGKPPVFFTAAPLHESVFQEMRETKQDIYEQLGVSQLSASNMKPAGLDSKPALREYKDTQNERHKTTAEAYDDFFLQIARIARALGSKLKGYSVRVPGASGFKSISTADLAGTKDEEQVLQCFPVSSLPRDPAGRTATIQEWVEAGWLTPRQGRKLMDFPDLQASNTLADAQEEIITANLDSIVDDGDAPDFEFPAPEPTDDFALSKEMVLHYIQLYRRLELEPEKLDLLRTYNQKVDELLAKSLAPLAAAPPMGAQPQPTTPQGSPTPAPQSELMPHAA